MNPLLNHLVQLQEMVLIKDEQKVAGGHTENLDAAIRSMTEKLPPEVRALFGRLLEKDHNAVVPIANGSCSVCAMKLPISVVQAVKASPDFVKCPTCARILYFTEARAQRLSERRSHVEPVKVGVARFSSPALMLPRIRGETADAAITELAAAMHDNGFVDSADKLVEAALQREAIFSTAFDHGLAFPHVRSVEGGGITLALGLSARGIRFRPDQKQLTRIVFFLLIPTAASAFYLKLLAGLTETFMIAANRKAILDADTPDALWKALVKVTRATIK